MSYLCCIPGCPNEKHFDKSVTLFPFPENDELKKQWILSMKLNIYSIETPSRICALHFTENDFHPCINETGKKILKENSIPTILPTHTKELCRINMRHSHIRQSDGSLVTQMEFSHGNFDIVCFVCGKTIPNNDNGSFEGLCMLGSRTACTSTVFLKFLKEVLVGVFTEFHQSESYICERCQNLIEMVDSFEVKVVQIKKEIRKLYQDKSVVKNNGSFTNIQPFGKKQAVISKLSDVGSLTTNYENMPYFPFDPNTVRHTSAIQTSIINYSAVHFNPNSSDNRALDVSNLCRVELQEGNADPQNALKRLSSLTNVENELPANLNANLFVQNSNVSSTPVSWISQILDDNVLCGKKPKGQWDNKADVNDLRSNPKMDGDSQLNPNHSVANGCSEANEKTFSILESHNGRYNSSLPAFPLNSSLSFPKSYNTSELVGLNDTIYCCPESACEAHFKTRSGLMNHMRHHRSEGPLECQHCHKQFNWWAHLASHVQLIHGDLGHIPPLYTCETCKLKFKDLDAFRQHVHVPQTQNDPNQYKCNSCSAGFPTLSMLNGHKMKEHLEENTFQCPMCVKTFHRKYNLLRHLENHDKNEEPEHYYQFTCQVCSAVFYRKDHLSRHLKIHQNIKPYECNICKKTFRRNDGLNRHQKLH